MEVVASETMTRSEGIATAHVMIAPKRDSGVSETMTRSEGIATQKSDSFINPFLWEESETMTRSEGIATNCLSAVLRRRSSIVRNHDPIRGDCDPCFFSLYFLSIFHKSETMTRSEGIATLQSACGSFCNQTRVRNHDPIRGDCDIFLILWRPFFFSSSQKP